MSAHFMQKSLHPWITANGQQLLALTKSGPLPPLQTKYQNCSNLPKSSTNLSETSNHEGDTQRGRWMPCYIASRKISKLLKCAKNFFFSVNLSEVSSVIMKVLPDDECLCPVRLPPTNLWTEFQIASTPASGPHHPLLSPHLLYFGPWMQRGGGDSQKWLQVVWLWTIFPNLRKGISNGFPRIGPPVMYQ